jgi:Flp pilus assembly secretin CpaC
MAAIFTLGAAPLYADPAPTAAVPATTEASPAPAAPAPATRVPAEKPPEQVIVSVKIIEFQATKGVETGLSAHFADVSRGPAGEVVPGSGSGINSVDLTFPTSTASGITVFLDQIKMAGGQLEVVLQALVNENRAFILSRPHAMVKVGDATPTIVETTQKIPYETTRVVGATAVQVTEYEDTGVNLSVFVPEIIDDDGNWSTHDDTYIRLAVRAIVKEEGQRIVIALDDQVTTSGQAFSKGDNAITVPEFVSRSITTNVWVRHGQVLMLGGLYRNSESKNIATAPLIAQAESAAIGVVQGLASGNIGATPISAALGNRKTDDSRRELVFLIKAETWRPAFSISDDLGFVQQEANKRRSPADVIADVAQGLVGILTPNDDKLERGMPVGGKPDELKGSKAP